MYTISLHTRENEEEYLKPQCFPTANNTIVAAPKSFLDVTAQPTSATKTNGKENAVPPTVPEVQVQVNSPSPVPHAVVVEEERPPSVQSLTTYRPLPYRASPYKETSDQNEWVTASEEVETATMQDYREPSVLSLIPYRPLPYRPSPYREPNDQRKWVTASDEVETADMLMQDSSYKHVSSEFVERPSSVLSEESERKLVEDEIAAVLSGESEVLQEHDTLGFVYCVIVVE